MKKERIGGVVVPIVTPIKDDVTIDFDAVEKLVLWLIGTGVDGIFVSGTTGRFSHFTPAQNAE